MAKPRIRIIRIPDGGDVRGNSFVMPDTANALGASVKDLHLMTLRPSHIRGNHFHAEKHERLLVMFTDKWSLHWDNGPDTQVTCREFRGKGAVLLQIDPLASHAIRNDGISDLVIIGWSDREFNPNKPDLVRRVVVA